MLATAERGFSFASGIQRPTSMSPSARTGQGGARPCHPEASGVQLDDGVSKDLPRPRSKLYGIFTVHVFICEPSPVDTLAPLALFLGRRHRGKSRRSDRKRRRRRSSSSIKCPRSSLGSGPPGVTVGAFFFLQNLKIAQSKLVENCWLNIGAGFLTPCHWPLTIGNSGIPNLPHLDVALTVSSARNSTQNEAHSTFIFTDHNHIDASSV